MILATAMALAATPIDITQPETLVAALQDAGYRAELGKDDTGDPMITSNANGAKFLVLFYGCEDNSNCTDLQFYSAYDFDEDVKMDVPNGFNKEYRFTRAYVDGDGDAVIEMDVMGSDGKVDPKQFSRALDLWSELMGAYQARIGF